MTKHSFYVSVGNEITCLKVFSLCRDDFTVVAFLTWQGRFFLTTYKCFQLLLELFYGVKEDITIAKLCCMRCRSHIYFRLYKTYLKQRQIFWFVYHHMKRVEKIEYIRFKILYTYNLF